MLEPERHLADWLRERGQQQELSFEQLLEAVADLHHRIRPEFTRDFVATLRQLRPEPEEMLWYCTNLMVLAVRLGKAEAPEQYQSG